MGCNASVTSQGVTASQPRPEMMFMLFAIATSMCCSVAYIWQELQPAMTLVIQAQASSAETVPPTREERKTAETAETQATSDPRLRGVSFMFKSKNASVEIIESGRLVVCFRPVAQPLMQR